MYFSVGVLHSSFAFMKLVKQTEMTDNDFLGTFRLLNVADAKVVLSACLHYNWVSVNERNKLIVAPEGNRILEIKTPPARLREQLYQMIVLDNPLWASNLYLGRKESSKFFPTDVAQCFEEAQLLNDYSIDIVRWWDKAANLSRGKNDIAMIELGRCAEAMSIEYEQKRTKITPHWVAIDSNLAGYDILSQVSPECQETLAIEVKGCRNSLNVCFYLTRNEWDSAKLIKNYIFHVWHINHYENILYILSPQDIALYVPDDTNCSTWEKMIFTLPDSMKKERKAI